MLNNSDTLETWDIVAMVLYFLVMIAVGISSMCFANRSTVSGFFLAGRQMNWIIVGASLFASNIGSDHFIGLAGSGAAEGISVGAFEFNATIILQLLGWVFLPVYIASKVHTLPEYMSKRFGGNRIRVYLAALSLVLYIFTKISVDMFSGALFINQSLRWNLYASILLLLGITALTSITGGLTAAIFLEVLQTCAILIGCVSIAVISFVEVGGYAGLREGYMNSVPNTTRLNLTKCGHPEPDSFVMLRDIRDPGMPWLGFVIGQTPSSIWYWAADQMMVQRVLSSKTLSHAQGGCILAGYLKLLPLFIMVMPGMISRVLWPDEVGCVDPDICERICGNRVGCSNIAYPRLVMRLLPAGLRGLMIAIMLASLVSDLSSIFNSASSLFTIDVWVRFRSKATPREMLIVGRVFNLVLLAVSIAWIPLIQQMQGGQLYIYIQSIAAYLAPPIAAVYLLAILWHRCNEKGAFWGLMLGLALGVTRMILDFVYRSPECGLPDERPSFIKDFQYLYYAFVVFVLSGFTAIFVSLCTKQLEPYRLIRTTFSTRFATLERPDELPASTHDMSLTELTATNSTVAVVSDEKETSVETIPAEKALKYSPKMMLGLLQHGYNWFCGLDAPKGQPDANEIEAKLLEASSLEQPKWVRNILLVNVALICSFGITIYAVFSSGIM
ncbi:sodium/myo-inositol cotransporter-like isoform X2 [Paramacrobiotus metropolitanus]|nr:sodium/myo-inositol cotransporter-like isoform X2 [Paramacrobiotus metropolitanus]